MSVMPTGHSTSLASKKRASETRPSGSLLQRPTEASVAPHGLSHGSSMAVKGKQQRKELTFKQQLLKKTLNETVLRPSGVLALHMKQANIYEIDPGGM